jgi:hypothetical protein
MICHSDPLFPVQMSLHKQIQQVIVHRCDYPILETTASRWIRELESDYSLFGVPLFEPSTLPVWTAITCQSVKKDVVLSSIYLPGIILPAVFEKKRCRTIAINMLILVSYDV